MSNEDETVFGERNASLSNEELDILIGGSDFSPKDTMEKLRDLKTTIFMSDLNKDGKLVGDEIKMAGLEGMVKEGSTREK